MEGWWGGTEGYTSPFLSSPPSRAALLSTSALRRPPALLTATRGRAVLVAAKKHARLSTTIRAAGGWVRDKILVGCSDVLVVGDVAW